MNGWDMTEKRWAALKWVADGCPVRDDSSAMKANAPILSARGLIKIRKNPWRAELTPSGRSMLDQPLSNDTQGAARPVAAASKDSVPDLGEVAAAGGILTIPNPSAQTRHLYRQALHRVTKPGLMPQGNGCATGGGTRGTWCSGWSTSTLTKRPRRRDERAALKLFKAELPEWIDQPHPLVSRRIKAAQARHKTADRKLRVIHLLATAFEERGYHVTEDQFTLTASTDDGIETSFEVQDQHDRLPVLDSKGVQKETWGGQQQFNLLAVDGPTNLQKGDGDAATWLPPNDSYRCAYVARQVAVKYRYGLWMTQAEADAIAGILQSCPDQYLDGDVKPLYSLNPTPSPSPTPSPTPPPAPVAEEPPAVADEEPAHFADVDDEEEAYVSFGSCAAARAAGYSNMRIGEPGYDEELDRDKDGVACES